MIVKSASHCRLENISLSGEWVESEEFEAEGKLIKRVKGGKVHPRVMQGWQQPSVFEKGVRVWGQPAACMDSIICVWHSRLISQEVRQCIHQVDMFSGELTDAAWEGNFLLHQIKHVIGAKQTAKAAAH